MLMSPRTTLKSCGNSSRLVFRSSLPTRVIRSSARNLKTGRSSSPKFDATTAAGLNHHVEELLAGNIRIRNNHFIGARFTNGLGKIFQIADHGNTFEAGARDDAQWAVIDNANHAIAKLRARAHFVD